MLSNENTKQIKSRQWVADHSEVFTLPREVNAKLNLVRDESFQLNSCLLKLAWSRKDNITKKIALKLSSFGFDCVLVYFYVVETKKHAMHSLSGLRVRSHITSNKRAMRMQKN